MMSADNRRFPRLPHVISRQIVHVDDSQNPHQNFVLTENLSASGIKFTTNRALTPSRFFLISLNDYLMREIRAVYGERCDWVRVGDYYLTRVVWVKEIDPKGPVFEVGATFLEKSGCGAEEMSAFTELMNVSLLKNFPISTQLAN